MHKHNFRVNELAVVVPIHNRQIKHLAQRFIPFGYPPQRAEAKGILHLDFEEPAALTS